MKKIKREVILQYIGYLLKSLLVSTVIKDYTKGGVPHHYANSTKMADTTPASFKNSYNTNCVMPPTTTAEDMSVLDLSAKPCKEASIMGPTLSGHTAGPGPGGVDCGRPGHGGQSTGSPGAGSASTSDDGDSPLDIKPSTSSSSDMTKMFQFPSLPGLVPPHPNTSMAGNAYNFTPTPRLPGGQPTMNGMFFGPHNMFPSPFGPAMMKDPLSNPLDSIDLLKNISKTSMGSLSSQDLSNMASFNTMNALGDPPVYPSSILEIKQDIEARLRRNEARQNGKRKSSSTVTSPPPSTMSRAPSPSSSEPDSKRMCTEEDDDDPHKELKDAEYMDRRKKNNEAAKRSRDARRVKEMKIARRCMFLEEENLKLKTQVELLRQETQRLHKILYNVGQQR